MTDYYAVLKRAVGGLEHEAGDVRRAVYDKARAALIGQLRSIDPPLTTAEISRQRLELEEAIRRVEREAAVTAAGPSPARARAAAAVVDAMGTDPVPPARRAPEPPRPPLPITPRSLQTPTAPRVAPPVRTAPEVQAAPPVSARPGPSRTEPANPGFEPRIEPEDAIRSPMRRPMARQEPSSSGQWNPPADAPARGPKAPSARDGRFDPAPSVEAEPEFDAPEGDAPETADPSDWAPEPFDAEPVSETAEPSGRGKRSRRSPSSSDDEAGFVDPPRSSPWPTRILIAIIVLILLGIGALAWSQRSSLSGLFSSSASSSGDKAVSSSAAPATDANGKNSDRLGDSAVPEETPKSVRTVDAVPPADGVEGDPLSGVVQPEGTAPPASDPVATAPAAEAPAAEGQNVASAAAPATSSDAVDASDDALVAQKAILYEQPTDGGSNVTALKATVLWKFEPNSSNGPEIQAQIDVPDRKMKVTVNIRKNTDSALPASHLVEVIADTPAEFPGGGIKSVPAFVMKPTEEARGQPLDGAAAKVADGYFWIAFANDAGPMAQNISLMKERNWIDIPLVYNDDQRAILTLEKGTPGQRVFEKALAAWGN